MPLATTPPFPDEITTWKRGGRRYGRDSLRNGAPIFFRKRIETPGGPPGRYFPKWLASNYLLTTRAALHFTVIVCTIISTDPSFVFFFSVVPLDLLSRSAFLAREAGRYSPFGMPHSFFSALFWLVFALGIVTAAFGGHNHHQRRFSDGFL